RALATYEQALAILQEVGDRAGEGTTLNNMGWVYLSEKDLTQARHCLEAALEIAEQVEYPALANAVHNGLARLDRNAQA
ncbi:MAG: tetratricopeptide repeat protein, partial [Anaerolineae bacterium]|nr:tetratricopeptide repeat protein [Anaerolineae bacterium]